MADKLVASEAVGGSSHTEFTGTLKGTKMSQDVAIQEGLLAGVVYDYLSMALSGGNTIETFTYKSGGSGGTTVAVVVVTYTTSDRDILSSVERTS